MLRGDYPCFWLWKGRTLTWKNFNGKGKVGTSAQKLSTKNSYKKFYRRFRVRYCNRQYSSKDSMTRNDVIVTFVSLFTVQVRDELKKQNPCLVEFARLPDQEKSFNLTMSHETLRTMVALGYHVGIADEEAEYKLRKLKLPQKYVSFLLSLWFYFTTVHLNCDISSKRQENFQTSFPCKNGRENPVGQSRTRYGSLTIKSEPN